MKRALLLLVLLVAGCGGGGDPLDGDSVFDRIDASYEDVAAVELSARIPGPTRNFRVRTTAILEDGRVVAKEVVRTLRGKADSRLLITAPDGPSYDWQSGSGCWQQHPELAQIPAEELTELDARIFHTKTMDVGDARPRGGDLLLPVDFEVPTESTWGDLPLSQRGGYFGTYTLVVDAGSYRVREVRFTIGSREGERLQRPLILYAVRALDRRPPLSEPEPRC